MVSIAQAVVTIVAIAVGGFWTYTTFVQQRQNHVRAQLSQTISDVAIPGHLRLLIVDEHLQNIGTRLVSFLRGEIRVVQVLPLPERVANELKTPETLPEVPAHPDYWKVLHYRPKTWDPKNHIVEPGETEQIHNEFVISDNVKVVMVLSYVYNPSEKSLGWQTISFYDLRTHALISGDKVAER